MERLLLQPSSAIEPGGALLRLPPRQPLTAHGTLAHPYKLPPLLPAPLLSACRAFREDRTLIAASDYIAGALGQRYVDSVPLNMERAWAESRPKCPLICLLSPGGWGGGGGALLAGAAVGAVQSVGTRPLHHAAVTAATAAFVCTVN